MTDVEFLIIGAGVAGLALGGDLQAAGKSVLLLDKGRIIGGRCTTKRLSSGAIVDYGAQFFTAKGERFVGMVNAWLNEPDSDLAIWNRGFPVYSDGKIQEREPGHPRYAPKSGMNALPQRLGHGLTVRTSTTITDIARTADGWQAVGHTYPGETPVTYAARNICLTLPAEQVVRLAGRYLSEESRESLEAVAYDPTWTVIATLAQDISPRFPALEFKNHPLLGMISRDHSKRGTPDAPPVLVINGAGNWSRVHLDDYKDAAGASILAAASNVLGEEIAATEVQTHRWRYATPTHTFGAPFFADFDNGLFLCGDSCGGERLENALTTGWDLAEAILRGSTK